MTDDSLNTASILSRRQVLAGSAALGLLALTAGVQRVPAPLPRELFISAEGDQADHFGLGWIDTKGQQTQTFAAAFRGHGTAQNPVFKHTAVMFSRHPGHEGIEVDVLKRQITRRFSCGSEHYFEGHGCYSADGQWLFTSETHRQTGAGVIGIYSTADLQKTAQFSSYGIEPHELKLMPDGNTLVVANGGLHYANPGERTPTNIATMASNLSYINSHSGDLIAQVSALDANHHGDFRPEHLSKASMRHLDISANGDVAIAMQVQRKGISDNTVLPLAALHKLGTHTQEQYKQVQPLQLLPEPRAVIQQLHDYMGSVAINAAAGVVGFTSPRGNLAVFWQLESGQFAGYHSFHDVCGIALSHDQQHFVLSNSAGQLRYVDARSLRENKARRVQFPGRHWDNHLALITV